MKPWSPALLAMLIATTGCDRGDTPPPTEATPVPGTPSPSPTPTPADDVRYTSLADCALVRTDAEGDLSERRCEGVGGYALVRITSDARENLFVVRPDGSRHSLGTSALAGGGFGELGERVEWRIDRATGAPASILFRYSVMEDPDPSVPETSLLFAARLTGDAPCVVARIRPAPDQNARARAAAERAGACIDGPP